MELILDIIDKDIDEDLAIPGYVNKSVFNTIENVDKDKIKLIVKREDSRLETFLQQFIVATGSSSLCT